MIWYFCSNLVILATIEIEKINIKKKVHNTRNNQTFVNLFKQCIFTHNYLRSSFPFSFLFWHGILNETNFSNIIIIINGTHGLKKNKGNFLKHIL